MKRFECLKILSSMIDPKTIVVANIGPISREWNALRPSEANLLQVNLGLCAAVGLGISVSLPHRQVVIFDGDGKSTAQSRKLGGYGQSKSEQHCSHCA